jgi:hypothetical protein
MPVVRYRPRDRVPRDGTYALVHEWGEPTGIAVSCEQGDRLPLVAVAAEGPLWYVLAEVPDEIAQAA